MCSSHSGSRTVILILHNPLLAISTDASARIKAPYVPVCPHPGPPLSHAASSQSAETVHVVTHPATIYYH